MPRGQAKPDPGLLRSGLRQPAAQPKSASAPRRYPRRGLRAAVARSATARDEQRLRLRPYDETRLEGEAGLRPAGAQTDARDHADVKEGARGGDPGFPHAQSPVQDSAHHWAWGMPLSAARRSSASTSKLVRRRSMLARPPSKETNPYSAQWRDPHGLRPPLAEREADAARVDDHRALVAPHHLHVRVPAGEHRCAAWPSNIARAPRRASSRRSSRRRSAASRGSRASRRAGLELELEARDEARHELAVVVGQRLGPPRVRSRRASARPRRPSAGMPLEERTRPSCP